MYEDTNDVMHPDSTVLREVHHTYHYGANETVTEKYGEVGPLDLDSHNMEPIDNDKTIDALLAAHNL